MDKAREEMARNSYNRMSRFYGFLSNGMVEATRRRPRGQARLWAWAG